MAIESLWVVPPLSKANMSQPENVLTIIAHARMHAQNVHHSGLDF